MNADGRETLVVGSGPGGQVVKVFDADTGAETHSFLPFTPSYAGGVNVAAGDLNGDGVADIVVGAGAGSSHVKVFDGLTGSELRSFLAFPGFAGGVSVAAGDVNGDGRADLVVGAGAGGGPHVKVFDGLTGNTLHSFFAFNPAFMGGVNVATGRNALGGTIIVGALSGGGQVSVFDAVGGGLLDSFLAFGPSYLGGVSVGGGSFGGLDSILVGALGGAGHVKVFGADRRGDALASFLAFPDGGVNVAAVFNAVPEPATWALMILGFGAAGTALRRRRPRIA